MSRLRVSLIVRAPQGGGKSTLRDDLAKVGWACSEERPLSGAFGDAVGFTATKDTAAVSEDSRQVRAMMEAVSTIRAGGPPVSEETVRALERLWNQAFGEGKQTGWGDCADAIQRALGGET